jgi:hypothetical protein
LNKFNSLDLQTEPNRAITANRLRAVLQTGPSRLATSRIVKTDAIAAKIRLPDFASPNAAASSTAAVRRGLD